MASNLVIVAIPADGDDVWQVSSEKKPHLTLLFLGDAMSNPNVTKIVDTVKDYSKNLDPFNLLVDHRGFLGDEDADVLFFTDDIPWKLVDFREQLKWNQEISMAYNAIPQHAKWKPHLTLGYPESPAHEDNWDPMVPLYVQFDKVAVWYGDSEGPEFVLTETPAPSGMDSPLAVAYAEQIGDELAHHGVKGMKWGVRKAKSGAAKVGRGLENVRFELDKDSTETIAEIASGARKSFKEKDLPGLKEKHGEYAKAANRAKKPLGKEAKAYRADAKAAYIKRLEESANSITNRQGTRQYTLKEKGAWGDLRDNNSKYFWQVETRKIQHAADGTQTFDVEVIVDSEGWISDVKLVDDVAQSAIDEILHYGVKGMKWGRRKSEGNSAVEVTQKGKKLKAKGGEGHSPSEEAVRTAAAKQKAKKSGLHSLSNEEIQAAVTRMNLEANFTQASQKQKSSGQSYVQKLLKKQGERHLDKVVDKGISLGVKAAVKAATG